MFDRWFISYIILIVLWAAGNVAFDKWQKYQNTIIFRSEWFGDVNVQYMVKRKEVNNVNMKVVLYHGHPQLQLGGKGKVSIQNIQINNWPYP